MTDAEILEMVRLNLEKPSVLWNPYLRNLIQASESAIQREGITLDLDDVEDCNLVVTYTAYLFRKRKEDSGAMPRMLRYALNNRLMSEKGKTT